MSTPHVKTTLKAHLQAFSVGSYIFQSKVASDLGLHSTDILAIHYLDQKGSMTASQLGTALGLTSGATTSLVDRLIKQEFASRKPGTNDRRQVHVYLNKAHAQKLKAAYAPINQKMDQILAQYTEEELRVLATFLEAVTQIE